MALKYTNPIYSTDLMISISDELQIDIKDKSYSLV